MASCMTGRRLSADESRMRRIRMRPIVRPRTSAARATRAFVPTWRRPPPAAPPPTRFVHLDRARESVTFWAPPRPAHRVEPRPSRARTPPSAYSWQPPRRGAICRARPPPPRSEPPAHRLGRLVKDRARGARPRRGARGALDAIPGRPPSRLALAGRTHDPLRPAQRHEIRAAVRLRAESVFDLQVRPRVFLCPRRGSHAASILKPKLRAYPTALYRRRRNRVPTFSAPRLQDLMIISIAMNPRNKDLNEEPTEPEVLGQIGRAHV